MKPEASILSIHPFPSGSLFMSCGLPFSESTALFNSATVPDIGAYIVATVLVDSTVPISAK